MKVDLLSWPAKSPDLNPIEMLWSVLDQKLISKPVYSIAALTDRLQHEWDEIDQQLCLRLIDSMPDRIKKCLAADGGHFWCLNFYTNSDLFENRRNE